MYFSTYFYHVVSECKLRAESCNVATQATTTSSCFKSCQNITFNQNKVCIVVFKINRIYKNVDI